MKMPGIFISHSSEDKELADHIIQFLELSLSMENKSFFCSSLPERSDPGGIPITESILSNIEKAHLIIGVITSASLQSKWVIPELSAAWGMKKWIIPVVVDVGIEQLPDWIKSLIIIDIKDKQQMLKLVDDIGKRCGYEVKSIAKSSMAVEKLMEFVKKRYSQEPRPLKFRIVCCFSAVIMILGLCLWEYVIKKPIVIGIGPHYTINKNELVKIYDRQYHTPFFSRYKIKFYVTNSYKDMLLDLLREKIDIAQVSPYTWLQFETNTLPIINDMGDKVKLESDFLFIGQKRYKDESKISRDYYQSCWMVQKNDEVLKLSGIINMEKSVMWDAIPAKAIMKYRLFLNQVTLSTSAFMVPFISLQEKGISPDSLYDKLEISTRVGMPGKVAGSGKSMGALAYIEKEQARLDSVKNLQYIRVPAKIPNDAIVLSQKKYQTLQINNEFDIIKNVLTKANYLSNQGKPKSFDIFRHRVGSAIITDFRMARCSGNGDNDKAEIDIWVPGPLNSVLLDKGFDYINTDIMNLRQYLTTTSPKPKLEIIGFDEGVNSTSFNTTIITVCKIIPDTIVTGKEYPEIMTIRLHCRRLPENLLKSPKGLVGYHIRKLE
jgi:ABC-type phosphate/phosphonate transport system substrate-binding protein